MGPHAGEIRDRCSVRVGWTAWCHRLPIDGHRRGSHDHQKKNFRCQCMPASIHGLSVRRKRGLRTRRDVRSFGANCPLTAPLLLPARTSQNPRANNITSFSSLESAMSAPCPSRKPSFGAGGVLCLRWTCRGASHSAGRGPIEKHRRRRCTAISLTAASFF
jgi:hypothetical protein